jgi:hypothetical protein
MPDHKQRFNGSPDADGDLDDADEQDDEDYAELDELEKLETIIALMEELGIETLEQARTRYQVLEHTVDPNA